MTPERNATLAVRDGIVEDAAEVQAVHWASRNAAYSHVVGWPPAEPDWAERVERWRQWLSDPEITSIVAEVNGKIRGICTIRASADTGVDGTIVAEMPTLYVHPDVWHRGYGRALCAEGLQRASERGFRAVALWSIETNLRAHAFYTRFGFVAEGVTKVVDWPYDRLVAHRYRFSL